MVHRWLPLSFLFSLWLGCGGDPVRGTVTDPARRSAPPVVVAEELSAEPEEPVVIEDGDTVTVTDVNRLLRAIRSNRTIRLMPGTYDLGTATGGDHDHVRWEKVYDGVEAVIHDVENLTITAATAERPTLLARPRYAFVLKLVDVKNVHLDKLVLGHTPEGGCTGGVVGVERAETVVVSESDLFGSGTVGLSLREVTSFHLQSSSVRECTYGIAEIENAESVLFSDSEFVDNREYDLVQVKGSAGVRFERCKFEKNRTNKGQGYAMFQIDDSSSVVLEDTEFEGNDLDQLTNDKVRLLIVGGQSDTGWASTQLAKPDPQLNQIYALARYRQWIVAGTQAGIVFWNPKTGTVDKLLKAYISNRLLVRGKYLWASTYRGLFRFDGTSHKPYLAQAQGRGGHLVLGPGGKLLAQQDSLVGTPSGWLAYDDKADRFDPYAPGGASGASPFSSGSLQLPYDFVVRQNGEIWAIDFLHALVAYRAGGASTIPLSGSVYPGRDPRSFYVDPLGKLWVVDFESGFFRYDDPKGVFVAEPTVSDKGSAMAIDAARKRTWLLHYRKGLHLLEPNKAATFFDLSRLEYMRALLLDSDGSVWVGGWNALVHVSRQGAKGWRERAHVVSAATLAPGVTP